ncbi:GntR family transcriptional regulator [Kiloniella laminariae]|uniref:GntR family transcriptional regulator n=1 Tax=Kiloniella laminariae TaxID=454162 RepID=A0ABT4LLY6_9PROT|nr:GntR family transcriptional regulator [Kiloniella laminariae]MCZ4282108.1 GntR family transcriptional regulator [Kiloniella laminariae]
MKASTFRALQVKSRLDTSNPTPLYKQLRSLIRQAIETGAFKVEDALPSERDIAAELEVSRVTVRKAVQDLVKDGLLVQKHGAGTFVAARLEQPLSKLTSFTEDISARGMQSSVIWIERTIGLATPEEAMALNLSPGAGVSRLHRIRCADNKALAIEQASIPQIFLPDPLAVEDSLYRILDKTGLRPQRALQRLRAELMQPEHSELLGMPPGGAALYIERRSFLPDMRPIEFTRSHYRGDSYDFIAELHLDNQKRND